MCFILDVSNWEWGRVVDVCPKAVPTTDKQWVRAIIDGETMETVRDFIIWAPKSLQMVTAAMKLKDTCSLEEKL